MTLSDAGITKTHLVPFETVREPPQLCSGNYQELARALGVLPSDRIHIRRPAASTIRASPTAVSPTAAFNVANWDVRLTSTPVICHRRLTPCAAGLASPSLGFGV